MRKDKVHVYRLIPILVIIGATAALTAVLFFQNELYWDELFCIIFLNLLFLMILIFNLEYERKSKKIAENVSTTFSRIAAGYVICCILVAFFYVLPVCFRPFLLLPLIMCAFSNESISLCVSLYFVLLFEIAGQDNYYELICYCILILLGVILAKVLSDKRLFVLTNVVLFCSNIIVTNVFYYLTNGRITIFSVVYSMLCSLLAILFCIFLYRTIKKDTEEELKNNLIDILSEDYLQVKELKKYMPADYEHARRVSDIAVRCAKQLGLQEELCSAGGFYYRIGKWQGEPHVQNGVIKAAQLCFPVELVQIILEYYGEEALPSTPESSLIHMIDALDIKFHAILDDVGKSSWNQEMIIYQTLNEFSNTGMYDQSGMSMNQFLKIREFLAKEKWS